MSDSTPTPKNHYQVDARALATTVGGFDESDLHLDEVKKVLTPTQYLLLRDTFGLLNGIALDTITTSQPRIRDNLIQIMQLVPGDADPEIVSKLETELASVLSRAASAGLSAENQSLTITRQHGRSR